jgi:hypothetical protein
MGKLTSFFPVATRPIEYVALVQFKVPTREGPAYVFMGCDAFSKFGFTGITASDDTPISVLKAIEAIIHHPEFLKHHGNTFTLVLEHHEELLPIINEMISPHGGNAIFYPAFHQEISKPLVESFRNFLKNGPRKK